MSRNKDVPGNVVATQALIVRQAMRLSNVVDAAEYAHREGSERDPWLVGFRVKFPEEEGGEFFVIVHGMGVDGPVVAFHSALGLGEAIRGCLERYSNVSLKWRDDEFRK